MNMKVNMKVNMKMKMSRISDWFNAACVAILLFLIGASGHGSPGAFQMR
jgi:hypothetical protein